MDSIAFLSIKFRAMSERCLDTTRKFYFLPSSPLLFVFSRSLVYLLLSKNIYVSAYFLRRENNFSYSWNRPFIYITSPFAVAIRVMKWGCFLSADLIDPPFPALSILG